MASATASMPKNQADRLPLSHQSSPQGLMISIDTRGAFFLMLQSQRGSIPGRILTLTVIDILPLKTEAF